MTPVTTNCVDHGQKDGKRGYGRVYRDGASHGAHRVALADHLGVTIADLKGQVVRHTCDNPRCINPDHLRLGTQADNMMDMSLRRRHGNLKLTEEQAEYIRANCTPGKRGDNRSANPFSYRALGRRLGVDSATIRKVLLGLTFRHKETT